MRDIDYAWYVALVERGHNPVLDAADNLDDCAFHDDIHNGPMCSTCGWSACKHCDSPGKIPICGEVW